MLPRMTMGNWLFWGIMVWIGFNFVWLRFVERFVPQWVGAIIATVMAMALVKYGPRPKEEKVEE
jgi:glycerol uptake facilitator-like aquaporin